ncbi:Helicase required for RNAi-mediated heterochromatin assembly 1 [Madurella mycetomatis]|uniref:Helicase required for RNAi-mediated heterochromatin assembly 1 n=1 Tax=Madurella mycetomatis TaxID=100816 RepID=A0A175WBB2_9PEZI|nr:Helicase required for RNAi-mediated heterochromatin assembly 1 [Madurella mycetomatis]
MASTQDSSRRIARLRSLFKETVSGNRPVRTPQNAQLFLEAIRAQPSPTQCVEILVSSASGLDAVRDAIRADLSSSFALSHTLPFLRYLTDPGVKALVDGQLLERVLLVIANPPTVLKSLVSLFDAHQIPDDGLYAFAWLACELISLPPGNELDVADIVGSVSDSQQFLSSQDHATRELGYKLQKAIRIRCAGEQPGNSAGPGGRHDNDFGDFRRIRIYPTTDEFLSTQVPYYQTAREIVDIEEERRPAAHLDNQFRLLREDMVAELREDIQVAVGSKKGKRTSLILGGFVPFGIDIGDQTTGRYKRCSLLVQCYTGLNFLQKLEPAARKRCLQDQPQLLRHQSFGVICRGKEILGFAFVDRDVDNLAKSPPVVSLQFTDDYGLGNTLLALTLSGKETVQFILVGTPVFAYEPVLFGLQRMTDVPLLDLLVNPPSASTIRFEIPPRLRPLAAKLESAGRNVGTSGVVGLEITSGPKVEVDESQLTALLLALGCPVSLIQGPPGTGKSFIGAQIARCLFSADLRILVLSYTNHALDQFMGDLLKAGIPGLSMVRIGSKSKCTPATTPLLLSEQKGQYRRSQNAWNIINELKLRTAESGAKLKDAFQTYIAMSVKWDDISEYLEFSEGGERFLSALRVPTDDSGWARAGKRGKQVGPDYLYLRWIKGEGPGIFEKNISADARAVWDMPRAAREEYVWRWIKSLAEEHLEAIRGLSREVNDLQGKIDVQFSEADAQVLLQKKVIGCTTTGAAKYARLIRAARPDVILVEEAGEILESHILTALAATVKQLILIGDHKQLRPKINNYALSVEKGDGFDLNRSLFERLINQGAHHATLHKQHRMVPEISVFARRLTYPDLLDGPRTRGRPEIHGLQDRVVFVNHGKQEDSDNQIRDRRDPGMKESKKNMFEAEMVLRCVKYFGQQGYASDQIVVLTPYLGQLRVLKDLLSKNKHDPALSEMDKAEMIRAGLISEAAAKLNKSPLRLSTIDNYQGEESDIVIVSLTRSNESGDIGFMSAPERLNVLITRARNCIVLIGNMDTFMRSKKGKPTWHPFFNLLKDYGHLYDGLPVKCAKHPEKTALLKEPVDFDKSCPDGGCTEPCNVPLRCRVHKCRSRCHRVVDHSRTECNQLVDKVCDRQHRTKVPCGKQKDGCLKCIQEDKEMERKAKRDLQLEEDRRCREAEYTRKLREIEDELEHQRRINKYKADEGLRKQTLEQRQSELAALKEVEAKLKERNELRAQQAAQAAQKAQARASQRAKKAASSAPANEPAPLDDAKADWEFQKQYENAQSKPMDELMEMIGLEEVKQEFLSLKSKVDTALRQNISMASERFSCSMLGNPGTGKTTVARLYAQFLTELCVIPGSLFKETTGAGLANVGVTGCKKIIDEILNSGGGVLFIDEAYQLTSGNNPGGGAVLDYLLAEVENLRGKVVFVLAGYNKQMESFFAHNPGLPSRFPVEMAFTDYTDYELLRILELKINKKYNDAMDCEDGLKGLYCRIVSRRIGRGRGKEGFGNARSVENVLDIISRRQADRIRRARKSGSRPDDLFFTKEDLIGPEPADALTKCNAWKELQDLIGLSAVKEAIRSLVDSIQQNYLRELAEEPPIQYTLNKVFLGNPGTGKTTVAKLYGEVLVSLGLLSKGEVIVKNPSDFVGAALGQSEQQTKGILAATVGKVLVIDEAYGLYGGGGGSHGSSPDIYKTAVIDTIVAEVQSVPGDDRCVLLLGYKDQMEEMFQNVNPGLSRRFPIASGFTFDDFSDAELRQIFDLKLKLQAYQATDQGIGVAMEMLKRARNRPNFGNAGEIDIILNDAKARHQSRFSKRQAQSASLLEAADFDENFDRAERSESNVRELFEGTVGCEETVALLEGYQDTVRTLKALDMDPKENIPFNFLFRGPPGTGKTTTAKKMGKVFYDMGFLATTEVVECSATDLIGQYVGQTGPKVQQLLDKALGRVLFVDEAYRLADGHFAKEAMDELVDSVTKDRYFKKLIIILAGYEADINRLMSVNSGLSSRFPAVVNFRALTAEECVSLMRRLLQKQKDALKAKAKAKELDLTCLESPTARYKRILVVKFAKLIAQDSWASARDVQGLAMGIFNRLLRDKEGLDRGRLVLTEALILEELHAMWQERESRANCAKPTSLDLGSVLRQQFTPPKSSPAAPRVSTTTATFHAQTQEEPDEVDEAPEASRENAAELDTGHRSGHAQRDAGVSDKVWEQLQRDRRAEEEREEEYRRLEEEARKATEAAREKIITRLLEEKKRREKEEVAKKKLEQMGVCPMGYRWIKQRGGYRCAGGSHWMSDEQLGL